MLGNCATGKVSMVRPPTSTMTIEITMATMGRLIKNLDMELPSRSVPGKWPGVHLQSRTHLLHALGDHSFARLESLRNDPLVADTIADFDGLDGDLVVVVHRRDLIAGLQLGDGTLRHQQSALLNADNRAHFAVAAGTQNISRIRKHPGDSNGPGTFIYLAIGKEVLTRMHIGGTIGQNQFEAQILNSRLLSPLGWKALSPGKVLGFADGEENLDGVDCGYGGHGPAALID